MMLTRLDTCTALLILVALIAGCAAPPDGDAAADAVERYFDAKVASDADRLRPLLCSALEAQLDIEVNSFISVDASLRDAACTWAGENVVACSGAIVATYGTEARDFPLGRYRVVLEDGAWRWCGEAG